MWRLALTRAGLIVGMASTAGEAIPAAIIGGTMAGLFLLANTWLTNHLQRRRDERDTESQEKDGHPSHRSTEPHGVSRRSRTGNRSDRGGK